MNLYRGLRGGSFSSYGDPLHASDRRSVNPTDENNSIGFRVAEVPGPDVPTASAWGMVTMILLVLTAGTVACRRRHAVAA